MQGEQVGILWSELYRRGAHIHFAHRTFTWSNEARGKAAVHCVIVGFGSGSASAKRLFDYEHPNADPHEVSANNINAYLVDAPDVTLASRRDAICAVPPIVFGSMPNDGGHLLLADDDRTALLEAEPGAEEWIRPILGADEFINGTRRWCLWLDGISPESLRALPLVAARVGAVKALRKASTRATTRELASFPTLFGENRQPRANYLLVPRVSSEHRLS
jgi:hypothetical protein